MKTTPVIIVTNDLNLKKKAKISNIASVNFNLLKTHLSDMIENSQLNIISTSLNFESRNLKSFYEAIVKFYFDLNYYVKTFMN